MGPKREASLTPSQLSQGWGALHLFFPTGGAAKGIPLKAVILGSAASIPLTHPFSVFAFLIKFSPPSAL